MNYFVSNLKVCATFVLLCIFFNYAAGQSKEYRCENTTLEITCQSEQAITVQDAFYGKERFSGKCGNTNTDISSCFYADAVAIVVSKCDNKQNCTIFVNSTDFPNDPCPGIKKDLSVRFACEFQPPSLNVTCERKYSYRVANTTTCTDNCPGFKCTPKAVPYVCVCKRGYLRDPITNTCIDGAFCPKAGDPQTSHQIYSTCANRRQSYCTYRPWNRLPHFLCPGSFSWRYFGCCYSGYICQRGYSWDRNTRSCVTYKSCPRWFL